MLAFVIVEVAEDYRDFITGFNLPRKAVQKPFYFGVVTAGIVGDGEHFISC